MLYPEEEAPLLKNWVVKRIEKTSDADAEVLAEYIIALLRHDGDKQSIRELCEEEIPTFLNEDAKTFLDDLFQVIAYRSYLPGAPPPPKIAAQPQQPAFAPNADTSQAQKIPTGPRKRGYHDLDAPGGQVGHDGHMNGQRPIKNARRGGAGGQRGGHQPQAMGTGSGFDPQNALPLEAFMPQGFQVPGSSAQLPAPVSSRGGRSRNPRRCRDFDKKGYCSRGATCPYDHGTDSAPFIPPGPRGNTGFDANDPMATLQAMQAFMAQFPFNMNMNMDNNRGRGNKRGGRAGRKGGARAPFSAEGPVHDRSQTKIVVENIPEENFSEEEVKGYFSQFGKVDEISMQPYKRLATIKFDTWDSANAAWKSHKAIFDNRFVKVFWFKEVDETQKHGAANGRNAHGEGDGDDAMDVEAEAEPEIDLEELKRKQAEAQEQFDEREKKRADLQRQREELEQKQKELLERHRSETERLKARLAEKNGENGDSATPASGASALREKLAALESEAKMLGIDPDAPEEDEDGSSFYGGRGGYGGYRGRGTYPPRGRGYRGRGRGGIGGVEGRHAAYAQYSLDNRPKRLAITGVDFTSPEKDESLRHFLLSVGEYQSIEPSSATTYVSFQDRKTAESFQQLLNGKELPGVEGTLDIQWASGGAPKVTKPASSGVAAAAVRDDDMKDSEQAEEEGEVMETNRSTRQEQEMDYERPEDDDAY